MADLVNKNNLKPEIAPTLEALLEDVVSAVAPSGASVVSAVLYGSAATKDYVPGKSDINVYIVFDRIDLPLLQALRPVYAKYFKKLKSNPVTLDDEYITDSQDVFPMEFLEWKEKSVVFFGEDPLSGLNISGENLRLQIEQNLRGKKLRLIQSYFEMDPKRRQLQPFLLGTLPNFIVVARNVLRLLDAAVASDIYTMLGALERLSAIEMPTFKRLVRIKYENLKVGDAEIEIMFKDFIAEIDRLIIFIDKFNTGGAK